MPDLLLRIQRRAADLPEDPLAQHETRGFRNHMRIWGVIVFGSGGTEDAGRQDIYVVEVDGDNHHGITTDFDFGLNQSVIRQKASLKRGGCLDAR